MRCGQRGVEMLTSECYRHLAATIAAAAGEMFHCPESRSDSRAARSCHHPPAPCLRANSSSPPPRRSPVQREGGKGVSGFLLTNLENLSAFISAALSVPCSRPREKGFRRPGCRLQPWLVCLVWSLFEMCCAFSGLSALPWVRRCQLLGLGDGCSGAAGVCMVKHGLAIVATDHVRGSHI